MCKPPSAAVSYSGMDRCRGASFLFPQHRPRRTGRSVQLQLFPQQRLQVWSLDCTVKSLSLMNDLTRKADGGGGGPGGGGSGGGDVDGSHDDHVMIMLMR